MYGPDGKEVLEKTVNYTYDENGSELTQDTSYIHPHNVRMVRKTKSSAHGEGIEGDIHPVIERVRNTYDGFNRLKKADRINNGTRTITEYEYNGDGLRTKKTSRSSDANYTPEVTAFLYDRQHVIPETDGAGNLRVRYIRGIKYISHLDNMNTEMHYLYNKHGNVARTTDSQGNTQNSYDYDIFGTRRSQ
jgi:YD repeat-containing protein